MTHPAECDGLVAIVTGGASGIDAAVSRQLMADGAKIAVLDLNIESVDAGVLGITTDVGNDKSVRVDAILQLAIPLSGSTTAASVLPKAATSRSTPRKTSTGSQLNSTTDPAND
jgi:NAD(P)-dependent dehydrogenase (short-subunit alcohol dehydrogenase family)